MQTAYLTLYLTFESSDANTDAISFAQQGSSATGYGNKELTAAFKRCGINVPCNVTLNLSNISEITNSQQDLGQKNITRFLQGGQLDVVYADDAIVSSAVLEVTGAAASPTPPLPILPATAVTRQLVVPIQ